MIKYFFIIYSLLILLCSCEQSKINTLTDDIVIKPSIKTEVLKNINTSEIGVDPEIFIYKNRQLMDLYEDDKLSISTMNKDQESLFKSYYYWLGDTLQIEGAFGFASSIGFTIKICNNQAKLYHLLIADGNPYYAYSETDKLKDRLDVLCTDTKIVLSEIPDSIHNQIIYGYVEFKSNNYFQKKNYFKTSENLERSFTLIDEEEVGKRIKLRTNMKIFFKSKKHVNIIDK